MKYSIVLANAKEFGGIIHSLPFFVTKLSFLKTFGSTTPEFTFVNILNSFETLASYPYEERPKEIEQDTMHDINKPITLEDLTNPDKN